MIKKAFLQTHNKALATEATYSALLGCENMGIEVEYFDYDDIQSLDITEETIVFGGVTPIRYAMAMLGITPPEPIDLPEELYKYTGREIGRSTIKELIKSGEFPLFVKPTKLKLFTGLVINSEDDLDYLSTLSYEGEDLEVITSSVVNFVSEYRVFVSEGKIIDCRKYAGDYSVYPNIEYIKFAIRDYSSQPIAYAIDFGVTDIGETMLIEVNDGYGVGTYGLDGRDYVKMSILRWEELIKNK